MSGRAGEDPARIMRADLPVPPDVYRLVPGLILSERLHGAGLADDLAWILPSDVLPDDGGAAWTAWGLPVLRHPGTGLYLAHRLDVVGHDVVYRWAMLDYLG